MVKVQIGPILDGGQAESWGTSWERHSLSHVRDDSDLISQMVAAGMQINIWITEMSWEQNHQELLIGKLQEIRGTCLHMVQKMHERFPCVEATLSVKGDHNTCFTYGPWRENTCKEGSLVLKEMHSKWQLAELVCSYSRIL